MHATCAPSLIDRWRQQFGRRYRNRDVRPLAALGYLTSGPIVHDLVEVDKFMLVLVHDETDARGNTTTRLAGYAGCRVPWGICWGGAENSRFLKNLRLQPMTGARGLRLDTASEGLLHLALLLDRDINRHLHYGRRCKRSQIHLPRLWAGFRPAEANHLQGDGPELEAYCARTGRTAAEALSAVRRDYFGLTLIPLAWVSSAWEHAVTVLVDLHRFPLRQVFPLENPAEDLIGCQDSAEYDLFHSRFRTAPVMTPAAEAAEVTGG